MRSVSVAPACCRIAASTGRAAPHRPLCGQSRPPCPSNRRSAHAGARHAAEAGLDADHAAAGRRTDDLVNRLMPPNASGTMVTATAAAGSPLDEPQANALGSARLRVTPAVMLASSVVTVNADTSAPPAQSATAAASTRAASGRRSSSPSRWAVRPCREDVRSPPPAVQRAADRPGVECPRLRQRSLGVESRTEGASLCAAMRAPGARAATPALSSRRCSRRAMSLAGSSLSGRLMPTSTPPPARR